MEREIDRRIGAASAVMRALNRSAMGKKELSRKAKHSIYRLIYVPILTCGHQRWVMTESQVTLKKIEEMQQQQQQLKVACIAEARKTADASGQAVTVLVGQIQLLTAVLTPVPHSRGVAETSRTKVRASKEATYPAKHVITRLTGWTCLILCQTEDPKSLPKSGELSALCWEPLCGQCGPKPCFLEFVPTLGGNSLVYSATGVSPLMATLVYQAPLFEFQEDEVAVPSVRANLTPAYQPGQMASTAMAFVLEKETNMAQRERKKCRCSIEDTLRNRECRLKLHGMKPRDSGVNGGTLLLTAGWIEREEKGVDRGEERRGEERRGEERREERRGEEAMNGRHTPVQLIRFLYP
ncbi:hypothetical protein D4764_07G0000520 [Takifugu flavidus]|uniref:Uncharacterized protein n=1 Tax=Takifugu flavidus TaxID=433684 RepID=A0A5C6MQY4_9TELE|nr:hypothetical protein D4764_07G0000520 [Takifugu flavidus]